MPITVQLKVKNLEETIRWLGFLEDLWRIRTADEFREWGQELTSIGKLESPVDKLRGKDSRRRRKSESFAEKWYWQLTSFDNRNPRLHVGSEDPRALLVVFPVKAAKGIVSRGPWPLRFFGTGGNQSFAWSVDRPRLPGNKVPERTIQRFDIDSHLEQLAERLVS